MSVNRGLGVGHEADQIAPAHVHQYGGVALAAFPDDLDRPVFGLYVGDLRKFDRPAARPHDRHAREIAVRGAHALLATDEQRYPHRAFQHDSELAAIDPHPQAILHVGGVEAEAAGAYTIDRHRQISLASVAQREHVGCARDFPDLIGNLAGNAIELTDIVAEDFHHHVPARADDHLLHAHVDRLRKCVGNAGNAVQDLAHFSHQPGRAFTTPGFLRRQRHVHVGFVQPGRINSQFVGTGAGHDAADLWNAAHQLLFDAKIGLRRFIDGDSRILADRDDWGALVHDRHEGLADMQIGGDRCGHPTARNATTTIGLRIARASSGS